jgi:hypothetical protein
MKTSRLNRVAGIFFALILTAGVAVSGEIEEGKGRNNPGAQPTCIPSISGLSEYQKQRINQLEALNQATMKELQTKRRTASEKAQKTQLKKQMDKQAENHRNSITSLLSADQQ